ncbi:phosphonate metabolism transcriptional regulator PhnF [Epibacterium sp. SM1979]|uniref:Phosphonate metabolism transcriptional regulator PhnF n=1 Tax=Tritonibacter litoralis TaxID=2662264 RepID=A0A843YE73_9RHOB|nr:phosphonate metabolism transcriptional regulator PhnF [Tritonibacter litoralis]MQQ09211.1 phosphonate metabolism transcriptional regulator PhnF [Tritonibacter litoralis]
MSGTPIWKSISLTLTEEIAQGRYDTGSKLPAESQLAARFGVNRHTVRRALAEMADKGLVHARRGSGVFVAASPTDYPLGKRVRFRQSLRAAGRSPGGQLLAITTRGADTKEAEALALSPGAPVHVTDSLSLADGQPVAVAQSCFPADLFPEFPKVHQETQSVTESFRKLGIADYTRAWTRLTAVAATPTQALHLRVKEGDPLLRSVSVNTAPDGRPIEFGTTFFAGQRITLTLSPDEFD